MNFFSKDMRIQSSKASLFFNFVKRFSSLKKLKSFFYLLNTKMQCIKSESFLNKFNDSTLVYDESISFFRNRRKNLLRHNPFLKLEDNFLLLVYNLKFFSLIEKRKKKKKVIADY